MAGAFKLDIPELGGAVVDAVIGTAKRALERGDRPEGTVSLAYAEDLLRQTGVGTSETGGNIFVGQIADLRRKYNLPYQSTLEDFGAYELGRR